MKNFNNRPLVRIFILAAMVAVIGLLSAGCSTDSDPDSSAGHLGPSLDFSGRVQVQDPFHNPELVVHSYSPYDGPNLTMTCPFGGTGTISGGMLNFTIEDPSVLWPNFQTTLSVMFSNIWDNVIITPNGTTELRGMFFEGLTAGDSLVHRLRTLGDIYARTTGAGSQNKREVMYGWVNQDVTITGSGVTNKETVMPLLLGPEITVSLTSSPLNIQLKAGWNALYLNTALSWTEDRSLPITVTERAVIDNPSDLMWVIY